MGEGGEQDEEKCQEAFKHDPFKVPLHLPQTFFEKHPPPRRTLKRRLVSF